MRNRKQTRMLCLLLCVLLAWGAVPVQAEEALEARTLLENMRELVPVENTRYLLGRSSDQAA